MVRFPLSNLEKYRVVLASNSPRRKELLSGLGITFEVRVLQGIDESYPAHLCGEDIPTHIAGAKARAYMDTLAPNELLITADTVVCKDGAVLGKPSNATEAHDMLRDLSGQLHQVITGVSLSTTREQRCFAVTSEVCFDPLSDEEIDYYVHHYRPFDKAGAYGIQEWIGMIAVRELRGSFFNVMGLPVQRLYQELRTF